ncbi:Uncharacterized conserved protein [Marinospirillum celere]|uniref:Uncharacterized conserved protein n=1 Tax=Marinospirillum celere TaxID=1122252 RepID=A0A1I1EPB5_9GAMM|nr:ATP-dependent zinc protease [Marinospirillum celere]SFB88944.1 Uncharacterized conserved protein [Marinospirillum celere]
MNPRLRFCFLGFLIVPAILLSGCETLAPQDRVNQEYLDTALNQQREELQQLIEAQPEASQNRLSDDFIELQNTLISALESELAATRRELTEMLEENRRFHRQHTFQIEELSHQLTGTEPSSEPGFNNNPISEVVSSDGQLIFGRYEWIAFPDHDLILSSRVDSGANTSSLHAINIREFERDGDTWIRFTTQYEDSDEQIQDVEIEAPLTRKVTIRQASGSEERPVVKIRMRLGSIVQDTEFTLTDRGDMSHPALLGRRFIMDIALIDVAATYVQPKPELTSNGVVNAADESSDSADEDNDNNEDDSSS